MHQIEFFFDCSSPWTYLAFEHAQRVVPPSLATIVWKPVLVGGVFNTVNPSVYAAREHPVPAKAAYARKDLRDWARHIGIDIGSPGVFPVNSVKAMRGAFVALEQQCLVPYARSVFRTYWSELADISQDDVLATCVAACGLDRNDFFARINNSRYKDMLRQTTDELIARGGFGSPTFFVDGEDMYFGNDRLDLLVHALTHG